LNFKFVILFGHSQKLFGLGCWDEINLAAKFKKYFFKNWVVSDA
jgi:hypothetical protein